MVLDEGRVVGAGTHEQLMESCQEYREIAMSQLSEEELKGGDATMSANNERPEAGHAAAADRHGPGGRA